MSEYLGFRCLTLFLCGIACTIYAAITCAPATLLTVVLFYIYKAVGLVIDILHGEDQLARRMDFIGISMILQGVLSLAAFAMVFGITQNLNMAIVAMTVAAAIVLFVFDIPKASRFAKVRIHLTRSKAFHFFRTSFLAVLASVMASAIFVVPKQYLAVFMGDAMLGAYASVAAPAMIVQMGAVYLYGPLLDIFAGHYMAGERASFVALLRRVVLGILLISICTSALLLFIGPWALGLLFGSEIAQYEYLLQPVILSTATTAFLWFFSDLMISIRDFRANFAGNVCAIACVLAASIPMIHVFGANGVSFAGASACVVGVLVLLAFLFRHLRNFPVVDDGGADCAVEKGA